MAVYVTGDLHGGVDMEKLRADRWPEGRKLVRSDYLIVAGDFGFPWDFSDEEYCMALWLEKQPWTTLFVDGNHECYDYWEGRPVEDWHGGRVQRLRPHSPVRRLMRGEVYEIGGASVFTLGGAASFDKDQRMEGVDWWPQELPDEGDFERARRVLDAAGWRVDYVVTHTCATRLLPQALYPSPSWKSPDRDQLTDFFDELEDRLDFKRWFFGHFHNDRDIDERHCLLFDKVVPLGQGVANIATVI